MNISKQLVNLNLIALMATMFVGCASSDEKEMKQMVGQVISTEGDSMLVVVAGNDTISMRRTNANTEMPLAMDSVVLYYMLDKQGQMSIEDVIVLNHNEPVLNNVTAMLIGKWEIENQDKSEVPFTELLFDKSLKAYATTRDGLMSGFDWMLKGKNVFYGSGLTDNVLKYRVVHVDANTLTVADQMKEYKLRRLYN